MKIDLNKQEIKELKEYALNQMMMCNQPQGAFGKKDKKGFKFWENFYDKLRGVGKKEMTALEYKKSMAVKRDI